jgi:hypothetical protein
MGSRGIATPFLTSALDGGEWSASRPYRLNPKERALGTHWIGGGGGHHSQWCVVYGLDSVEKKNRSCRESNPNSSAAQPVAIPTELFRLPILQYDRIKIENTVQM